MTKLNISLQTLLTAVTTTPDATHDVRYLWDLINPVARFVLLNQTQISQLPFNITSQLQSNVASLNWTQLSSNVQTAVLNQPISALLSLTYQQWGWVDSTSSFSSTTLLSLLSTSVQSSLNNVYILLAPLAYNSQIDLTVLNATLTANVATNPYRYERRDLVRKFFGVFFEYFNTLLPAGRDRFKRGPFRPYNRQPTAQSTFSDAVKRAQFLLRSLGLRCE